MLFDWDRLQNLSLFYEYKVDKYKQNSQEKRKKCLRVTLEGQSKEHNVIIREERNIIKEHWRT